MTLKFLLTLVDLITTTIRAAPQRLQFPDSTDPLDRGRKPNFSAPLSRDGDDKPELAGGRRNYQRWRSSSNGSAPLPMRFWRRCLAMVGHSQKTFSTLRFGKKMRALHATAFFALIFAAISVQTHDQHRILFTRIAPTQVGLFVSNSDGTEERPLLPGSGLDYNPRWSPDGQWIVFTSERNGSADLYRVKSDGTGPVERLTDSPAFDDQASSSPDGNQLVFVTSRADGTADLWILDLRRRKVRALTSGPGGDFRPAWSPDGQWIAFSSDRGSTLPKGKGHWEHLHIVDIYLVHPDGAGLRRITEHGDFCGSPTWTQDSRRVVAVCMSGEDTMAFRGFPAREGFSTRLVSIDITTGQASDISAPAGANIAPTLPPSGDVRYLEVRLGTTRGTVRYTSGKRGPNLGLGASWSPDGNRIVYSRTRSPVGALPWQELWSRDPEFQLVSISGSLPSFDPSGKRFVDTRSEGTDALEVVNAATHESRIVFHDKERTLSRRSGLHAATPSSLVWAHSRRFTCKAISRTAAWTAALRSP